MRKANIIAAAIRINMNQGLVWQFVEFFSRRFPDESNNISLYVDEWAYRFNNGTLFAESRMDEQSLSIWYKIKEELE